jgi:hypothetical protein
MGEGDLMSEFSETARQAAERMFRAYDFPFCVSFVKYMVKSPFHNDVAHAYWAEVLRELDKMDGAVRGA